jgi:hypothetical protein
MSKFNDKISIQNVFSVIFEIWRLKTYLKRGTSAILILHIWNILIAKE